MSAEERIREHHAFALERAEGADEASQRVYWTGFADGLQQALLRLRDEAQAIADKQAKIRELSEARRGA